MAKFVNNLGKAAEKIMGQAVNVASDCVQAAADFIESKSSFCEAKIALTALREKRDDLYKELGALIYSGKSDGVRLKDEITMELDHVCSEIAEYEKICNENECESEGVTEDNSSTVFCGDCGAKNSATKAFCNKCGASLKD